GRFRRIRAFSYRRASVTRLADWRQDRPSPPGSPLWRLLAGVRLPSRAVRTVEAGRGRRPECARQAASGRYAVGTRTLLGYLPDCARLGSERVQAWWPARKHGDR